LVQPKIKILDETTIFSPFVDQCSPS